MERIEKAGFFIHPSQKIKGLKRVWICRWSRNRVSFAGAAINVGQHLM
jgi:hypothetical protein